VYDRAVRGLAPWLCAVVLAGCGRFGFPQGGPDAADPGPDGDTPPADAGADGPPGIDAMTDAPMAVTCPPDATLCDGFESGDLAQWTRLEMFGPAMMEVNAVRPRTGQLGLEASVDSAATDDSAAAPTLRFPAMTTGTLATRLWFNLDAPLEAFNLLIVFRNHQTGRYVSAGGDNNGNWVSTEASPGGLFDHLTTVATPPLATWQCVELVYTFPAAPNPGRIQLFVADTELVDVTADEASPAFTEVQIGIARGDEAGFHVFVDDVVIDDQRILCD
jgi:hypothetical protein